MLSRALHLNATGEHQCFICFHIKKMEKLAQKVAVNGFKCKIFKSRQRQCKCTLTEMDKRRSFSKKKKNASEQTKPWRAYETIFRLVVLTPFFCEALPDLYLSYLRAKSIVRFEC